MYTILLSTLLSISLLIDSNTTLKRPKSACTLQNHTITEADVCYEIYHMVLNFICYKIIKLLPNYRHSILCQHRLSISSQYWQNIVDIEPTNINIDRLSAFHIETVFWQDVVDIDSINISIGHYTSSQY